MVAVLVIMAPDHIACKMCCLIDVNREALFTKARDINGKTLSAEENFLKFSRDKGSVK